MSRLTGRHDSHHGDYLWCLEDGVLWFTRFDGTLEIPSDISLRGAGFCAVATAIKLGDRWWGQLWPGTAPRIGPVDDVRKLVSRLLDALAAI